MNQHPISNQFTTNHVGLLEAIELLQIFENGNKRNNGTFVVDHPWRMLTRNNENLDWDQKTACILHDLVEDEKITLEELEKMGFSSKVREIVKALSRHPRRDDTPAKDIELYIDFIRRLSHCHEAIAIKIADIEDNMSDLDPNGMRYKRYALCKKYLQQVQNGTLPAGAPIEKSMTKAEQTQHQQILRNNNSAYYDTHQTRSATHQGINALSL